MGVGVGGRVLVGKSKCLRWGKPGLMVEGQEGVLTPPPHLWEPEGPTGGASALPTRSAPEAGSGRLASVSRRDPPVVFVLIFLNKRCYPRQGGPCVFD